MYDLFMTSFPKPRRQVNRALLDTYHEMRCIICNRLGSDPHHLISVKAGGPDSKFNVVALCRIHHQQIHMIGLVSFSFKYPEVYNWLLAHGWTYDETRLKWYMPKNGVSE